MNSSDVCAYYASFGEREWQRMEWAEGVVEFAVTTEMLTRHLPATGRVLDIGGGPGRYAQWLAGRGYRVTLADLSPELLDIARARIDGPDGRPADRPAAGAARGTVEAIVEADARDLSRWARASFDAVLSLGPMYHLPDAADRRRAIAELARVLRPGGTAFIALMPWLSLILRTISVPDERRHLADPEFVAALRDRGEFRNDVPGRFAGGYGVRTDEVAAFIEPFGFMTRTFVSTHGFATRIEKELLEMRTSDPGAYDATMRLLLETAADPSILGTADHLLYVGERVAW